MFTVNGMINLVLCFVIGIPFWFLLTLVHEMGHGLVAVIGGGKPQLYLYRGDLKSHLKEADTTKRITVCHYIYPRGLCHPNFNGIPNKGFLFWVAFNAGGVIAELLVMGLVTLLALRYWGYLPEVVKLFLALGASGCVAALTPHKTSEGLDSDGKTLMALFQRRFSKSNG
ncbi:hypothetical protein ACR6HW_17395 [Fusibacter sp. JL298sf-3]